VPASRPTTAGAKHQALRRTATLRGCDDGRMARFKNGDKVIITQGDFNGQWGTITDKDVIGDELTVVLAEDGREIRTHEAHVSKVDD
jgi:transcription antitermination factor NusG